MSSKHGPSNVMHLLTPTGFADHSKYTRRERLRVLLADIFITFWVAVRCHSLPQPIFSAIE